MPRRRWLQYSLRSIAVAVTATCICLGIVANRANRQHRAVDAILAGGGRVIYEWQDDPGRPQNSRMQYISRVSRTGTRMTFRVVPEEVTDEDFPSADDLGVPQWLRDWLGPHYFHDVVAVDFFGADGDGVSQLLADLPHLRRLDVSGSGLEDAPERLPPLPGLEELQGVRFTAAELPLLQKFPNLDEVHFAGHDVADADLMHLAGLKNLRRLRLAGCPIDGHGLAHLAAMTQLEELNLAGTNVDDEGLARLAHLTALKRLTLTRTRITDAGLVHLRGLSNLHWLQLSGTQVTFAGAEELEQFLPGNPIVR